jgi:serine/threonine protein kinase
MAERWEEVESLFGAALTLSSEERSAFLTARAGADPALRAEVESLLAADAASGSFLGEPGGAIGALASGSRVGSYELLSELGRGGSGVVFLARSLDGRFDREVAIKLLRPGLPGRILERRFFTERAILGRLDHPHLARLLDVGTAADGRPYYVMEHVEGVAIDRHCDERCLSIEERLSLFALVCDGVEFAHFHGVVHRDIKPANILVTAAGTPKLLDFGIAKLLGPQVLSPADTTGTWMRVLTPQYASPEQVLGRPVSPASDVYSLGVLLYLLLTGRLPYRLPSGSLEEIARVICRRRPPRPSAAVLRRAAQVGGDSSAGDGTEGLAAARGLAAAGLARRLVGEPDRIVGRALAKKPRHRHPSAGALAAEIREHLSGRTARAGPARFLGARGGLAPALDGAALTLVLAALVVAALTLAALGLGPLPLGLGSAGPVERRELSSRPRPAVPRLAEEPSANREGSPQPARAAIEPREPADDTSTPRLPCVPDGGVDDTLGETDCCSGLAVDGSTVCAVAADFGTTWSSCRHLCATRPVRCIPPGGVDDALRLTDCCSGVALPGSTRCLDQADFGTTWRSCVQICA